MNLFILLHVKAAHQAEKALDVLMGYGGHLPEDVATLRRVLKQVHAVGICERGRIHLFFKSMDAVLPACDVQCHVYEEAQLDAAVRQDLITRIKSASCARLLREMVAAQIQDLAALPLESMNAASLAVLFRSLRHVRR